MMVLSKLRNALSFMNKAKFRFLAVLLLCLSIAVVFSYIFTAKNTLVIYDEGDKTVVGYSGDPQASLSEAGIQLSDMDSYVLSPNGVPQLTITRAKTVNISFDDGSTTTILCNGLVVADALKQIERPLSPEDVLDCDLNTPLTDGMTIHFSAGTVRYETQLVNTEFETLYIDTDALPIGQLSVIQPGVAGQEKQIYRIVERDGQVVKNELDSTEVLQEPTTALVWRGTCPPEAVNTLASLSGSGIDGRSSFAYGTSPVPYGNFALLSDDGRQIVTASGDVLRYTRKVTVSATAYTTELDANPNLTYTETVARVGAIAVDPSVIPLGSRLYIVGADGTWIYGYASAEDMGGGIVGNRVDLFYDTHQECVNFGTHTAEVCILG